MSEASIESKRRALVELRMRRVAQASVASSPVERITAVPRDGRLPLSYQQEGLWFLHQLNPSQSVYNMPYGWRLRGRLDVDALRVALASVVARHEALRTRFGSEDGRPYQVIDPPPADYSLPVVDVADGEQPWTAEASRPFDLATGPLFRSALFRLADDQHVLALTAHHIVADGWSFGVLTRELAELYRTRGAAFLPPLAVQPADVAVWQRDGLGARDAMDDHLAYWRRKLDGLPELNLPTNRPRPALRDWGGASVVVDYPAAVGQAASELSRVERVSFFAVLKAAFLAVLARYCRQDDVVVGSVFGGRTRSEVEPLVGYFASTVVLRTDLAGDPTFRELVTRCNDTVGEALTHQDVPFATVVDALRPDRDPARNPLFQVSLAYQPGGAVADGFRLGDLDVEALEGSTSQSRFDLSVSLSQRPDDGLRASVEYATELFDGDFVRGLVECVGLVLGQGVRDPGVRLSGLRLVGDGEARRLVREWNPPPAVGAGGVLSVSFDAPENLAVVCGRRKVTYRELQEWSGRLAASLRSSWGVGPQTRVGVLLDRGVELVTAQVAVVRAGAAWVPLDVSYPAQRLQWQIADAGVRVVLTARQWLGLLPPGVVGVCVDEVRLADAPAPVAGAGPDHLAYVMYTSGSTGRPKGVLVSHRSADDFVRTAARLYGLGPTDRVLQFANPCFDVSVFDIFATLASGATLICAPREELHDPDRLTRLLRDQHITVAPIPPAVLARMDPDADLPDLRTLVVAGEAFGVELVERWSRPDREFHNGYGPTETTVLCTDHLCEPGPGPVPIGRAMANHRAYILDNHLTILPPGVPGELHIAGTGLALGYLNQPALTAERFLPDPYSPTPGQRMYRTGDLARWHHNGTLEYLGRTDRQIKIRGIRIEPAEIEHALTTHPAIQQATVTTNNQQLHAYVVPTDPTITETHLRTHLLNQLPTHLIPATITPLPQLPLNPNGKIDQHALPTPTTNPHHTPPTTPTEHTIAHIWHQILNHPLHHIHTHDNFFTLGGNSLQAIQLITRIRDTLHTTLDLRGVYLAATVAGLAAAVDERRGKIPSVNASKAEPVLVPLRDGGTRPPLFCVHAIGGSAAPYVPLTALLDDDRPVYGLEAPGLHGGEPLDRVETLAERYLAEIRRVRPVGPYHLLGWSAGGLVALELACLLTERHGESAEVVMLDTAPPPTGRAPGYAELLAHFAADLAALAGVDSVPVDFAVLRGRPDSEQDTLVLAALEDSGLVPPDIRSQLRSRLRVFVAVAHALRAYRPRPFSGRATLLGPAERLDARRRGWAELNVGAVEHLAVPGTHYTMLRPPHVEAVAAAVAGLLAAADPRDPSTRVGILPALKGRDSHGRP